MNYNRLNEAWDNCAALLDEINCLTNGASSSLKLKSQVSLSSTSLRNTSRMNKQIGPKNNHLKEQPCKYITYNDLEVPTQLDGWSW